MRTEAGIARPPGRHGSLCWIAPSVLGLFLSACGAGSPTPPRPIVGERCVQVGGDLVGSLSIASPADGVLRVRIEERGVSVVATLDADASSAAESPVDRLGTLQLITKTARDQRHTVTVRSEDSPDIRGQFCVRADLIATTDSARSLAERSLASGGAATHRHDWNGAFESFLQASRAFDGLRDRSSSGASRHAMAELAYRRLDRKRDSYALATEAVEDFGGRAPPFVLGGLAALQAKALMDIPQMNIQEAAGPVKRLEAAARRYFQANPAGARELPRLDIMAGFRAYRLDDRPKALGLLAQAARACRLARDWSCYAIASQDLANLEYEGNNYTVALATFAEALRSLPSGLNPKLAGDIWNNYGELQGMTGLFSDSAHSLAAAMREYALIGDCQGVRRNLAGSGYLMAQLGSLSDAMHSLQQSAALDCGQLLGIASRAAPSETAPGAPLAEVAWCEGTLDPQGLAIENKLIVFESLVSLGNTLLLQGESARAQRCLSAAGPYASSAQARMRLAEARGDELLERQDAGAAQTSFQESIGIAAQARIPPANEIYGLAKLGLVKSALLAGNAAQALPQGMSALQASVNRGDVDQTVAALRLLAASYRQLNQPERAARTLQTAVALIEAVPIDELDGEKRATYLATQYNVFAELTDLYAAAADRDALKATMAFVTSERGRARSLRYAITQAERDTSSPDPLPTARYKKLLQNVVNLTAAHAGAAPSDLVEKLNEVAAGEHAQEEPFNQQNLAPTLQKLGATLLEYAVGTHDMFAFVVNESGLHVIRLGDSRVIAGAAGDLHDRLLDPETPAAEIRDSARRLAELVLWPVSGQLTAKRLIIVPDDGLHAVPFNLLPWSRQQANQLVLQRAEVSIAPSARFLTTVHANGNQHSNTPRIELLGDPVFRVSDWRHECSEAIPRQATVSTVRSVFDWTESLPRLAGSRAEVQMVARLSQQSRPGSHVETLLGCAAVPSALRRAASGRVDLLHIATHARVDSQRPRLSALALTPEHSGEETASAFGLLDILGLKLSSGLVVLSACETSRGRLLPGEGVLGPAQAFLQAGAGAVVASYWKVDDLATTKFMQGFYKFLLAERLPAATALRRAQLEAAGTSLSYDWAAFALYGWPDSAI